MGWDAYARPKPTGVKLEPFKEARKQVLKHSKWVDGGLADGGLDLSDSTRALSEMTGWGVYDEYGWSREKVKGAWSHAQMFGSPPPDYSGEDYYEEIDSGAYWSAWYFLKTCAENNLKIDFSF